jgi:hypothetical protein
MQTILLLTFITTYAIMYCIRSFPIHPTDWICTFTVQMFNELAHLGHRRGRKAPEALDSDGTFSVRTNQQLRRANVGLAVDLRGIADEITGTEPEPELIVSPDSSGAPTTYTVGGSAPPRSAGRKAREARYGTGRRELSSRLLFGDPATIFAGSPNRSVC